MTPTSLKVPYTALGQQTGEIKQELMGAFEKVLDGGRYILGTEVSTFEREFAEFCGSKGAVSVANGTCALHLVMRDLGVGKDDEVITAPNSFIASASTIALAGARPVFVDVQSDLNMDPARLEAAITPRTKVIIPVHLTGRPARMVEILKIAERHHLFVLEDAAQAVGAKLNGQRVGSWGNAACFSLHPLKNLYAIGDGGIVTGRDQSVFDRLMKSRNHGLRTRDECEFWSYNCRLDEVQAAMLRVQLRHLERRTETRRQLAFRYNELLRPYVTVPDEGPGEYCVYQTYMIQADHRDELKTHLVNHGVEVLIHYPTPIHLQPAAKSLGYKADDFPMAMQAASRILSLPLYPGLSQTQQDYVVELIRDFYKSRG